MKLSTKIVREAFQTSFVRVYQRSPKDDEELMSHILAVWFAAGNLKPALGICTVQGAAAIEALQGTEELMRVTKGATAESIRRCLRLFANGLTMFLDMCDVADLEAEVTENMKKAMDLKAK